jgi:hypothetical protein
MVPHRLSCLKRWVTTDARIFQTAHEGYAVKAIASVP